MTVRSDVLAQPHNTDIHTNEWGGLGEQHSKLMPRALNRNRNRSRQALASSAAIIVRRPTLRAARRPALISPRTVVSPIAFRRANSLSE
jgi:hypothetical protein